MTGPAHHRLDIYGADLHLATDKRQWATLRRRLPFLDRAPEAAGISQFATWHPKGPGLSQPHLVFWIDLANHTATVDLVDTIAHEASHGASQLLDWAGHDVRGTDEPHAYLVGWLARWLWTHVGGESRG